MASAVERPAPRVSVVIPTHNRAGYLRQALRSVLDQSVSPFEIIVVDDGSTDGTGDVVRGFEPSIRYVRHDRNRGVSAARNSGLELAQGEAIAWLDADDLWERDFLSRTVSLLEAYESVDGVYAGCAHIDDEGRPLPQSSHTVVAPSDLFTSLIEGNFIATPAIVVRTRCFDQVGGFDLRLGICEDYDMWLRLADSFSIVGLAMPLVKVRVHADNTVDDTDEFSQFRLAMIQKHFGPPEGDPRTWSDTKRRAFAFAYRDVALRFGQAGERDHQEQFLERAVTIWPDILNRLDTFYELACGTQPRGVRGHAAELDIEASGTEMLRQLDGLLEKAEPAPAEGRSAAYGNAHVALAMLSDQAGDWSAARHYVRQAVRANPRLLTHPSILRRWLKLCAGKRLAKVGRRLSAAWQRIQHRSFELASSAPDYIE